MRLRATAYFWQGQPVAAVAAVDRHVAEAALDLITVDYEPLHAVLDIAAAIAPDAPLLNPDLKPKGFDGVPVVRNAGSRTLIEHGDAAAALAASAAIGAASVVVDTGHQAIEPHACVAEAEPTGNVTIWALHKAPSRPNRRPSC